MPSRDAWDEDQRGGVSRHTLTMLEQSGTTLQDLLKVVPEASQFREKVLRGNKNVTLPAGVESISLKAGWLDCALVFNAVQKHGGPSVRIP